MCKSIRLDPTLSTIELFQKTFGLFGIFDHGHRYADSGLRSFVSTNQGATAELILYTSDHSLYCAKVRIVLRHKRLDYHEAPPPGGGGSPNYLSIVPSGNIPALVDQGLVLMDSEVIAEYLEEKHPAIPMLPPTLVGRAKSRDRSRFADTRLEPALRLTFPHVDPKSRNPETIAKAHQQITKRLTALARLLESADLPRERLWMGDPGTIVTLEWLAMFDGVVFPALEWPSSVTRYRLDMAKHAAVADELAAYRPKMMRYMHQKGAVQPGP